MSLPRLAALLLPASLLVACGSNDRVRYRMTVEVETPEGLRTGSAVRESLYRTPPNVPMIGEDRGGVRVRGEAVAVDLPNRQTLFALLSAANDESDYSARIPSLFLGFRKGEGVKRSEATIWPVQTRAPLPLLVRFRDINDPGSIEEVQPNNFSASFGPGVELKRIIIQVCRFCTVTNAIDKRFSWWPQYQGKRLNGTPANEVVFQDQISLLTKNLSVLKTGFSQ